MRELERVEKQISSRRKGWQGGTGYYLGMKAEALRSMPWGTERFVAP